MGLFYSEIAFIRWSPVSHSCLHNISNKLTVFHRSEIQGHYCLCVDHYRPAGGRVVRWCWVSFQCWGVLLIWSRVGQGPSAIAGGAGGGCLGVFFSLVCRFSSFSLSLGDGLI